MLSRIILLAALAGACGICLGTGGFAGPAFLWQLPLLFLGLTLGLLLLAFLFLWACCAVVRMDKPVEEDSRFYRQLLYRYEELAMVLLQARFESSGFEETPANGRFLVVCNHLNILDPLILHLHFKKSQLAFISKKENESLFLVNKLMHKTLCMPIDRENDRAALHTILQAIRLLKDDKASIAVFPEGYTSRDGRLHEFRNGVFKIAQKANVPIVVCTVRNTQYIFHNAARLRPTRVPVKLLAVIRPEELQGKTTAEIGGRVYEIMAADLKQA